MPSNLSCGASQPDAVPDCRPEPAGGASQPAEVPCANPNCKFCAHPQPAEKHWAGYCCGACRLRYLNGKGMDHGRRCQQRPQQRAGVGQRAKEQRPRAGAGATQPGVQSGKKRKATTSIPRPADVAQYREHLHTLGLTETATLADVRKTYRALALRHHPDKHMSGGRKLATERFQRIVAAYEAVSAHRTTFATTREP